MKITTDKEGYFIDLIFKDRRELDDFLAMEGWDYRENLANQLHVYRLEDLEILEFFPGNSHKGNKENIDKRLTYLRIKYGRIWIKKAALHIVGGIIMLIGLLLIHNVDPSLVLGINIYAVGIILYTIAIIRYE